MATQIMGVLNVTPDSFSDGGRWFDQSSAVAHGLDLLSSGADILDIGGESTRPGATRVDEAEELRRVIPVVRELAGAGARISVDTMRARVAAAAIDAGAQIINDVSAGLSDPAMLSVAADTGVPIVLMHWRGYLDRADASFHYDDVVAEVIAELRTRIDAAVAAGVDPADIIVDPGLGFSKNAEHNWQILAGLSEFAVFDQRLLVAASRKRFIASLVSPEDPAQAGEAEKDEATAVISAFAAQAGAWAVRVHDPASSALACRVAGAIADHSGSAPSPWTQR
ncbi:dihydropteroate synthase [Brevibacterium casei]|uniref:Dihydropteroate synthase n=2 Tax=Bacteria TaxID=2 RepID=A0A269Z8D9_9MICO|nr:dihydropteroate synthase [Brevibacterium casei]NJE65613.1 dihydropteroate synthase [Brevibacterium sp. LS14]SII19943.1 dihydropteroate synthase 1 FolP1 [Mycobacteroides abscessus subsp. abscessus]MBE4695552.1 dihydropteroate synthase [Brevibacterium casei]MBY3578674.1 dihydropteroate synthase [Brevibacterium casei]MCT1446767.1 dihydropteroate synthase [Brevibacterium casei]